MQTTNIRTSDIYQKFADQLTGIVKTDSDQTIDGTYWNAAYYSPRMDDSVFDAVKEIAQLHLDGKRVQPTKASTDLQFLSRLRCVDSLSDYLILAIQAAIEEQPKTIDWMTPNPLDPPQEETGFLDGEYAQSENDANIHLVHIADLIDYSKLSLKIPTKLFTLEAERSGRTQRDVPSYCFVSHAWVDHGMPDTEDGKFFRAFVLLALSIYIDTGIEFFWIDYLCVSQEPSDRELRARQISQIPWVVKSSSYHLNMCLEIYQYHTSAWCTLETLSFLAENRYCHPLDFIEHIDRSRYRFGMNVVDATKVNANEKILYSFTDAPLECGSPDDMLFLNSSISQAKKNARIRVWRMVSRKIKSAVGLEDMLGTLVTEPVAQFLRLSLSEGGSKSAEQTLDEIMVSLRGIAKNPLSSSMKDELIRVLQSSWGLIFAINGIGYFRPDEYTVTPRKGDVYKLDLSQLKTSYAFHNQKM